MMASSEDPKVLSPLQVLLVIALAVALLTLLFVSTGTHADSRESRATSGVATLAIVVSAVALRAAKRSGTRRVPATAATPAARPPDLNPEHPVVLHPPTVGAPEPDAPARRLVPIELIRELMGATPRSFPSDLKAYLRAEPPAWLTKRPTDEMMQAFVEQDRLRREGHVVWAQVVQANNMIWERGPWDHGASVIWSTDSYFDDHGEELASIAHDLFALKGEDQADPQSAAFSRMLTNEMMRGNRLPVPSRFTSGRKVFHSSLMLTRRHLPQGYLARGLMPVWCDPTPTGLVLLVPAAYWPPSLTAWWKRADDERLARSPRT